MSKFLLPCAVVVALGCAGQSTARESASTAQRPNVSQAAGSIRLAIQVGRDAVPPIYVAVNEADDQPGWVRVSRNGERIYLRERCDIPDCGEPAAVCGAAIPLVQDLKGDASLSSIEFTWDGMTSVIDRASGCESREPATEGDYVARFCYSREAEFEPGADRTRPVPGSLVSPTCLEKSFTLRDSYVAIELP